MQSREGQFDSSVTLL
nr:unnamed protein product [Callosobruchus chinensis]